jgi:putative tryptophan/tyrosine transport system substrate-binding protein
MKRPRAMSLAGRVWVVVFLALTPESEAVLQAEAREVLVVSGSRAPAYEEAVSGLRTEMERTGAAVVVLEVDTPGGRERLPAMLARKPAAVVAVGTVAAAAVALVEHKVPSIVTMVLSPAPGSKAVATITLEVAWEDVLNRLTTIYPGRTRIALIRGPALSEAKAREIESKGHKHGFRIQVIDCPGPKELVEAFGPLRGRFDFVWFLPDSALYQGPTVSALVLAGIRHRLPIIGFSEGLVKAGALIGFYPDYRDIGAQAGASAVRILDGRPPQPVQHPRTVKATVNERVTRVFGLESATGSGVLTVQ